MALAGAVAVGGASKIVGPVGATLFHKNAGQDGSAPEGRRLKAAIVYYSATGSTLKAAKAIHRGLKTVMDCDIFPVKRANAKKMGKYDLIGLASPCWYSRETANIKLFTHNLPKLPGKLAFLFCTHGVGPNGTFGSLAQTVEKRKLTIIGWSDWYGGVFHVLHQPKPYHTDGHPDKIDLDEAEAFGTMIGQKAQKIYAGDKSLIPQIPTIGGLWTGFHGAPGAGGGGMMGGGALGGAPGGAAGAAAPGAGGVGKSGAAATAGVAVATASALPKMGGGAPSGGGQQAGGPPSGGGPGGGQQMGGGAPGGQAAAAPHKVAAKAASAGPGGAAAQGGGPPGGGGPGGPAISTKLPTFYMDKCVYPRCNACEDMCPVNAIDFSMVTPGRLSSGDQVLVKKACVSCSLCERVCVYDAVIHGDNGPRPKTSHAIDLKICTYPKCQLCLDNCPMNAIDFSTKPPTFHHDCEGCDMCWCVCPTGAVSIPNMAETQGAMANRGPKNMPGGSSKAGSAMVGAMNGGAVGEREAFLPENIALRLQGVSPYSSPFRRLVPEDQIGYDHIIQDNPNTPRIIVDPEDGNTTYCSSPCKVQTS